MLLIKFSQQYKLFILSLAGDVLGSFKPDQDPGFGIRNVVWHPSDMFLAVSGWDNKVSTIIDEYEQLLTGGRFTYWSS